MTSDIKMAPTCKSSWDRTTFIAGTPKSNRHNDEKNGSDKAATIEYTWTAEDKASEGTWCFIRTYLPTKFKGGLILTTINDADTNVALKVSTAFTRYFNSDTLPLDGVGKAGKIGLYEPKMIEIFLM